MRISDWSSDVCSSDLLAALNRPQLGLERYRHHLSLLTRDIAELAGRQGAADSLEQRLAVLNAVLVERYGHRGDGDTYDDTVNANPMRVVAPRRALPVALGLPHLPGPPSHA